MRKERLKRPRSSGDALTSKKQSCELQITSRTPDANPSTGERKAKSLVTPVGNAIRRVVSYTNIRCIPIWVTRRQSI
jgi:hypothetical protein